ncbi:MAG: restriction endonuclease [Chloroflexi bacterium RIFOXYD12_FULL_57_15]|nr:MAG: restriction endonuclease [Chloroflexi bacterium RIFOXYD12_FULL_57_15]
MVFASALYGETTQSKAPEKSLFGVTDGKAVGTYLEHKFRDYLKSRYAFEEGSLDSDIAFSGLLIDIKAINITQPHSFCPFKSVRQKVYGLGYSIILLVYDKIDDDKKETAKFNIWHTLFIEAAKTADYQMTRNLRQILENEGNRDDILAFLEDMKFPIEDVGIINLADEIISKPPAQGYSSTSTALQWQLRYSHAIQRAELRKSVLGLTENLAQKYGL